MDEGQLEFLTRVGEGTDWDLEAMKLRRARKKMAKAEQNVVPKLSKSQKRKAKKRTKATIALQSIITAKPTVETLVFDNPDKKSLGPRTDADRRIWREKKDAEEEDLGGLDMKKARFEIMKFGMNALSGDEKQDAETAMAISLGAKAAKSAYVNYKELQENRKKEKDERKAREASFAKPVKLKPKKGEAKTKPATKKNPTSHTHIIKIKNPENIGKKSFKSTKSKPKASFRTGKKSFRK